MPFLLREIEINPSEDQSSKTNLVYDNILTRKVSDQIGLLKKSVGMATNNQIGM
jgi:hypothetical protein